MTIRLTTLSGGTMEMETLNLMQENMYRVVLMLIECITLMVGAVSVLFILVSLVCAVCGFFAETKRPARLKVKPEPPVPDARELMAVLANLDEDFEGCLARREPSSIQQA